MTSPHQIHEKEPPLSTILLQSSQAEGSFGAQAKKKKEGILLFNYMKQAANQHNWAIHSDKNDYSNIQIVVPQ